MTASENLAYQDLRPDDIIAAVESLGLRCDGTFLALNSYENRVYQVGIEDETPVVVKFYRPGRWSDMAIREEHAFAFEIADAEVPIVPPINHDGVTLHFKDDFRFAVYPRFGGRAPELDDEDLLRQLGRFMARIHNIGETKTFDARPRLDVDTFGTASSDYLLDNDFIPPELEDAYTSLCEDALDRIDHCFERAGDALWLRIHGDAHPGNVLVRETQLHIVDLDDARMGPAVQDLWMFLSGDQVEQTPQLANLLAGYTEFREFDARELNLIEALRTLRIMHYAAWLARRWSDPAFKQAFPWFNGQRYWEEHILALREQLALMDQLPLSWDRL